MSDDNKIHIDADWKAEAQADKEKLAAKEAESAGQPEGTPKGFPPADFKGLMGLLASQAIMGLGAMQDPDGRGLMIDLEGARYAIDMLVVMLVEYRLTAPNLAIVLPTPPQPPGIVFPVWRRGSAGVPLTPLGVFFCSSS